MTWIFTIISIIAVGLAILIRIKTLHMFEYDLFIRFKKEENNDEEIKEYRINWWQIKKNFLVFNIVKEKKWKYDVKSINLDYVVTYRIISYRDIFKEE